MASINFLERRMNPGGMREEGDKWHLCYGKVTSWELRKSGSLTSRMVQIESNFTSKSLIEALVFDPLMRDAAKSLPKQAAVPASKASEVKKPNAPR